MRNHVHYPNKPLLIPNEQAIPRHLDLEAEITRLKKDMNAVILAHYYQESELQDIADFIGDSLELSRKARDSQADVIVFCGVTFMAEVAKILSPDKLVLVPDMDAGCSLEDSCPPEAFKAFREKHPDHLALTYINCSAEVKALSDIIVTSSNAEHIIRQIPKEQKILFSPDRHLGAYLAKKTDREMLLWNGACIVHEQFNERELVRLKSEHPNAPVIAHPECPENLLAHAQYIGSTSKLLEFAREHNGEEIIVMTEPGILHQMRKASPDAVFFDVPGINTDKGGCFSCNNCPYMKRNTMEKLYMAMVNQAPYLDMPEAIRLKAKAALDKMLEMSPKPATTSPRSQPEVRV